MFKLQVRKSACTTCAGSSENLRWLTPFLGPNMDPKMGSRIGSHFSFLLLGLCLGPVLGSRFGPKSAVSHRRILLLRAEVLQADLRRTSMSVSVNTCFFSLCVPLCFLYSTEEARTCEAWFQLTFWPQKWNLKAHVWYQLSPFPSSNVAICDAAPPRQHSPILRYSALLRYSVLCFNSSAQCNWHDIETMAE